MCIRLSFMLDVRFRGRNLKYYKVVKKKISGKIV